MSAKPTGIKGAQRDQRLASRRGTMVDGRKETDAELLLSRELLNIILDYAP